LSSRSVAADTGDSARWVPRITLSRVDCRSSRCMLARMERFAQTRWARMSSGQYCLIRDLGLVKGGKGLRHHEVVLTLSCRGLVRFAVTVLREIRWREAGRGLLGIVRAVGRSRTEPGAAPDQALHQPDVAAEI